MNTTLYEVDSITYFDYAKGREIRFPRFQRKDVWNTNKQFALLVSVFKGYPIGVVVVNEEKARHKDKGVITTSWLLDGRQRRTTLIEAYNNPEMIYECAKKFIGFKNNDQPTEVEEAFWRKLELYLESDEESLEIIEDQNYQLNNSDLLDFDGDMLEEIDDEDAHEYESNESGDNSVYSCFNLAEDMGLKMLLKIILLCHNKKKTETIYMKPFINYGDYFYTPNFIVNNSIDSKALAKFLRDFIEEVQQDKEITQQDFIGFCQKNLGIKHDKTEEFSKSVSSEWDNISQVVYSIWDLVSRFQHGKMPLIRLNNVRSSDAQNIFKLINSSGTSLTAVEILSAKPSWNRELKTISDDMKNAVDALYKVLNVKTSGVVKWDVAATFISRLNLDCIFKPLDYKSNPEFKTKVTLGFKLLSAIYEKGINKENMSNLAKNKNINWENIDDLISDINSMGSVIEASSFFQTLTSWNNSLMGITSEAVALNFTVLIYMEWLESRSSNQYNQKAFTKKAISLFDRGIYEYVTRNWKGSSDSRLADNINKFNTKNTFEPIDTDKWKQLINDLVNEDKIGGNTATTGETKAILYYYYMLSTNSGPGFGKISQVDHVIPQEQFKNGIGISGNLNKDNLANLCLLQERINNKKTNDTLSVLISLMDQDQNKKYMIDQICKSLKLTIEDLKNIEKPEDLNILKTKRIKLFQEAFSKERTRYLQR